ncbi:hypothetical protein [Amphritea sp.]|uniref:hypothetical protein n=1 Tax=Amphritea sp. TaxID=1872502 RepID=UPI0025C1DEF5|nr:hypothetical protein [Amphritea sp.]
MDSPHQPTPKRQKKPLNTTAKWMSLAILVSVATAGILNLLPPTASDDTLSAEQIARIHQTMSGPVEIPATRVRPEDLARALATFPNNQPIAKAIADSHQPKLTLANHEPTENQYSLQLEETKTELVWIKLWDFASQDGDIVEIESAGYRVQVLLKKEPAVIAVPVRKGGQVTMKGVSDGGGGITVALNQVDNILLRLSPGQIYPVSLMY